MEPEEKEPLPVRIKYYTTLTLGLVACLSCFIFMFLVPFVLDPAISTLVANFDPEPVICQTVYTDRQEGIYNCTWTSCKNGCTVDLINCTRIYVNYMNRKYSEYMSEDLGSIEFPWTEKEVPIYVNIKACGYEPKVNCSAFEMMYSSIGDTFPCYYSRVDPKLVITDYSWDESVNSLIMAIVIPNALTGISLAVLSYWWYPGCQKRRCHYQLPPDQEVASSHPGDAEEDDDDDNLKKEKKEGDEVSVKSKSDLESESKDTTIIIPEVKA